MKKRLFILPLLSIALFCEAFSLQSNAALAKSQKETVSIDEMIDNLSDSTMSSFESNYLLNNCDYSISYNKPFNNGNIKSSVLDGYLYLSSTCINAENDNWIPLTATYNNQTKELSKCNDEYFAKFDYLSSVNDFSIQFEYSNELNQSIIDNLSNEAYIKGNYYSSVRKYSQYCQNYTDYQSKIETYNYQKQLYEQYKLDLAAYNTYVDKLEEYNQYKTNLAKYIEDSKDATNDISLVNAAKHCIDIMNIAYTPMDLIVTSEEPGQRVMYESIMGGSVTSALESAAAQAFSGVDPSQVNACSVSTNYLREVLTNYKEKTSDKEKYLYFYQIYDNLFKHSYQLFRYLTNFLNNATVNAMISAKKRMPQYQLLIGQLALFSKALANGDGTSKEKIYTLSDYQRGSGIDVTANVPIFNRHTLKEIIGNAFDSNTYSSYLTVSGKPKTDYFPILASTITKPKEVKEPAVVSKPTSVNEPIEPNKPEVVNEPIVPEGLDKVASLSEEQIALADAFDSNLLFNREISSYIYKKEISIKSSLLESAKKIAIFKNDDSLFDLVFFDESFTYTEIPEKSADNLYKEYTFDNWLDKSDSIVSNEISDSTELHASFTGDNPQQYEVTFVVGDKTIKKFVSAGRAPSFSETPVKDETDREFYIFKNWDRNFEPIFADQTYTAIFETKNKYLIEFEANGEIISTQFVKENTLPNEPKIDDIIFDDKYLVFSHWNYDISLATCDRKYVASFDEKPFYTLAYKNELGNDIISKVKLENIPQKPNPDCYYTLNEKFVFYGWEMQGNNLTGKYLKASLFNDNTKAYFSDGILRFDISDNVNHSIDVSSLNDHYLNIFTNCSKICFDLGNTKITLSSQTFSSLLSKNISNISFNYSDDSIYLNLKISALEKDNSLLQSFDAKIDIESNFIFRNAFICSEDNIEKISVARNVITSIISFNKNYEIKPFYNIVVSESEGVTSSIKSEGIVGENIVISFSLENGYSLDSKNVTLISGNQTNIINGAFIMPNNDVEIKLNATRITYVIKFYVDGKVYETQTHYYGERITIPTSPTLIKNDGFNYEFVSWNIDDLNVSQDMTYIAKFNVTKAENKIITFIVNNAKYFAGGSLGLIFLLIFIKIIKKGSRKRSPKSFVYRKINYFKKR